MSPRMKQIGFGVFTFLVYAFMIPPQPNWGAAAMLVVGVGFHELSHLWAAKKLGLKTKGFYLVPFMGGVAFIEGPYKRYSQQAFVVLMGPVGGGVLALATAVVYHVTGVPFLAAAASWMCWLNMFNLLPLSFLDGGQLLDTVSYSLNRTFGMVLHVLSTVVASVVLWYFNPVIAVIVIVLGGGSVFLEIRNWKALREGNRWLCSDAYLNPPQPLSRLQMAGTLIGWGATLMILYTALYLLKLDPNSAITTIIHK